MGSGVRIPLAHQCSGGAAAARERQPDLILLDVMMPKVDGIEVCRRLKADADLPFMAIVLVTARADAKDIVAGLEAGADDYLTKPVDQTALVARVRSDEGANRPGANPGRRSRRLEPDARTPRRRAAVANRADGTAEALPAAAGRRAALPSDSPNDRHLMIFVAPSPHPKIHHARQRSATDDDDALRNIEVGKQSATPVPRQSAVSTHQDCPVGRQEHRLRDVGTCAGSIGLSFRRSSHG
jgi:CheY-like chemotaxis protein